MFDSLSSLPLPRHKFDFGVKVRARLLTTIPDSTSQKFLLLGTLTKKDKGESGERHIVVHIDFAALEKRKCSQDRGDFEKWYARTLGGTPDCLMGHKVSLFSGPPGSS